MSKKEIKKYEENKKELNKILKIDKMCRTFAFILTALEGVSLIFLILILIFNNKNHDLIYFLILNISIGLMILSVVGLEISKCKRKKEKIVENLEELEEKNKVSEKSETEESKETKETPIIVPVVTEEEKSETEEIKETKETPIIVPVATEEEKSETEEIKETKETPIIVPVVTEEEKSETEEIKETKETPIIVPVATEEEKDKDSEEDREDVPIIIPIVSKEESKETEEQIIPIALPVTEFDNDEDNYDDLEEIHVVHEVNVEEANELMSDVEAAHFIHEKETFVSDRTNRGIVNVRQLSRYFVDDEVVTLEGMKVRIPGFDKKLTYVKVLADGILDKPLKVYADDFSIEAAKMILLTGGRVVKARKK